ncbi:U3 small nucleolar ribonucleo MPP10 [Micractinium conductrix]|uniref:U3 small nucleolar ribonucleo MPP10 n=1 Tax=Micractinium conductrix TaxID=554055 RepID=A0A2P6VQZ5_9CHLO|nr:U3 small nucleolar ribonucleo MPP10 [Micractinium conductrix]|eukprot:PSC76514.1 U3 small nucleolar ribonucleo MPP10 [Micractinium conductrix]
MEALGGAQRTGFVASRGTAAGEVLLQLPGDLAITSVDVGKDPALAAVAEGRSELVGLALWLLAERAKGPASAWAALLATLPSATPTPVLWPDEERAVLLRGSPVLAEARAREAALRQEWAELAAAMGAAGAAAFPPAVFNEQAFLEAMSVVLAKAAYLPTAQCFALLPLAGGFARTGSASGAVLDYDMDRQAVTLVVQRPYSADEEVKVFDGRPNGELLLATGSLEAGNPEDCLFMEAGLVAADRLYTTKRQILEEMGMTVKQEFPIAEDRLATQHLVYLRLARLQDPAQLAKIDFARDDIISPENEYEILQLLMGDLRDKFQAYATEFDDDIKDLQRTDLTPRQRLAAQLRLGEKRILRGTMDGVRRRLAPIRGIPTKGGGMQDPNADFKEIFDTIESIPTAPKRLLDGFNRWFSGADDPTFKRGTLTMRRNRPPFVLASWPHVVPAPHCDMPALGEIHCRLDEPLLRRRPKTWAESAAEAQELADKCRMMLQRLRGPNAQAAARRHKSPACSSGDAGSACDGTSKRSLAAQRRQPATAEHEAVSNIPSFVTGDDFSRLMLQLEGCVEARLLGRQPGGDQVGYGEFSDKMNASKAKNLYHGWTGWGGRGLAIELTDFPLAQMSVQQPSMQQQMPGQQMPGQKRLREGEDMLQPGNSYKQPRPDMPPAMGMGDGQPGMQQQDGGAMGLLQNLTNMSNLLQQQGIAQQLLAAAQQQAPGGGMVQPQQGQGIAQGMQGMAGGQQMPSMQQRGQQMGAYEPYNPAAVPQQQPMGNMQAGGMGGGGMMSQQQAPPAQQQFMPQQPQQGYGMGAPQQQPQMMQGPGQEQYGMGPPQQQQQPQMMQPNMGQMMPQQQQMMPQQQQMMPQQQSIMPQQQQMMPPQQQQGPPMMGGPGPQGMGPGPQGMPGRGDLVQPAAVRQYPPDACNTLYIEGLPADVTKRELAHIFRPREGFRSLRLVIKDSKKHAGEKLVMAFVEYTNTYHATEAMDALQGYVFDQEDPESMHFQLKYARPMGRGPGGPPGPMGGPMGGRGRGPPPMMGGRGPGPANMRGGHPPPLEMRGRPPMIGGGRGPGRLWGGGPSVIELTLPASQEPIQATVLSCSATMQSVRLQELGSEEVHRISLKKLPVKVVKAADGSDPEAAGGQPDAQPAAAEHQQQQQEEQQQGGSGDEEGEESGSGSDGEQPFGSDVEEDGEDGSDGDGEEGGIGSGSDDDGGGEDGSSGEDEEEGDEEEEEEAAPELDAFSPGTAAAVEAFATAVEADPAAFLQPAPELAVLARGAAKALYDYQAALEGGSSADAGGKSGGKVGAAADAAVLPELYVEGFDAEQIWLQLELAAAPALRRARKLLKKAGEAPALLSPETEAEIDDLLEGGGSEGLSGSEGEEEEWESEEEEEEELAGADLAGVSDLAELDYEALLAAGAAHQRRRQAAATAGGSESEEEDEGAAVQRAGIKRKRGAAARAAVEDEHFKLDEMEAFLQQAEREAAGLEGEEGEEGEDEEGEEDDEEAALDALLNKEMAKGGLDSKQDKKARKKKKKKGAAEDDEEQGGEDNIGATATFEDFFGPRYGGRQGPAMVAAGGRQRQEELDQMQEEQDEEDEEGSEEEEDEEGFEDDMLSEDMLSGEEEEEGEEGGRRGQQRRRGGGPAAGDLSDDDEDVDGFEEGEEDSDKEEEDGRAGRAGRGVASRALLAESDEEEEEVDEELAPSAHERRQHRLQEKIQRLEETAMGEKEWFMRGEIDAGRRPKNSALEVDLDFDTTVKPAPAPTEEMTASLDDLIKKRIAEGQFDDVVRIVPPPPESKRTTLELDDSKPQQGLGELYEAEYMQQVAGVAEDKDEAVRQAARAQFSALVAKLDALSHLHFTPRPVLEEVTVKVDVPAIMMEEAAPQFVSGASMQAPEEVFASGERGAPRADEELSREDRKRRRAQKKRAGKNKRAAKEEERTTRAVAQGGAAPLAGRKSEAAEQAARKLAKAGRRGKGAASTKPAKKSEFSKSAAVFAKIQQHADGTTAAAAAAAAASAAPRATHLKL